MAEVQLFCTIPPYFNVKINPTKCFIISCTREDYEKKLASFDRYNKKTFISYAENSYITLGPICDVLNSTPFWNSYKQYSLLLKPALENRFCFFKLMEGYSIDRKDCFDIDDFQLHFQIIDDYDFYNNNLKMYKGVDINQEVSTAFEIVDKEKQKVKMYDVIMQRAEDELLCLELHGQKEYKVIADSIEKLFDDNRSILKLIYKFIPKVMIRFDDLQNHNFAVALCIYNIHIQKSLVTVVLLGKYNLLSKSFDAINTKDILYRIQRSIEGSCKGWHNNPLLNGVIKSGY